MAACSSCADLTRGLVGIGFAKEMEHNLALLQGLDRFSALTRRLPLLVGTSRKRFLGTVSVAMFIIDLSTATVSDLEDWLLLVWCRSVRSSRLRSVTWPPRQHMPWPSRREPRSSASTMYVHDMLAGNEAHRKDPVPDESHGPMC